jgi:hypothetical protein
MSHHIIDARIVRAVMKAHELIYALMVKEGKNPTSLAKAIKRPTLQPQLHRFFQGEVARPEYGTAELVTKHFGLPLNAMYDEKVATAIARERGIKAVPIPAPKQRIKRFEPSDEASALAREFDGYGFTGEELQAVLQQCREVMESRGHALVTPPLTPVAAEKPKQPKRLRERNG